MTMALTVAVLLDLCSRSQNENFNPLLQSHPMFPEVE
jgi:hypothetical protein